MENGFKKATDFSVNYVITEETRNAKWRAKRLSWRINQLHPDELELRTTLLSELLGTYNGTPIESPFICDFGHNTRIGKGCFFNYGLTILDTASVTIGDNVLIGPGVKLCTAAHPIEASERMAPINCGEPIIIEDKVWIGASVTVLPGVTIGENSVIGAGSVVTQDVPANVVAVGVPCRVIKRIDNEQQTN